MPDYRAENVAASGAQWLKRNAGVIAVTGGLVVILAVVVVYGEVTRQRDEERALSTYENLASSPELRFQKLADLATNYGDTSVGPMAKLDYANELYTMQRYGDAQKQYESVLTQRDQNLYGERARLGLAYCAVQTGEYEKARKLLEEVKAQDGVYAPEAIRMLKRLENPPAIPEGLQQAPVGTTPVAPTEPPPTSSGKE